MYITIIGKTPSVNQLYRKGRHGNVYLTEVAEDYKREIALALVGLPFPWRDKPLCVSLEFFWPQIWRRGKPVRRDVDNPIKICLDAICEALGIDDAWVFQIRASKRQGSPERVRVGLMLCEDTFTEKSSADS